MVRHWVLMTLLSVVAAFPVRATAQAPEAASGALDGGRADPGNLFGGPSPGFRLPESKVRGGGVPDVFGLGGMPPPEERRGGFGTFHGSGHGSRGRAKITILEHEKPAPTVNTWSKPTVVGSLVGDVVEDKERVQKVAHLNRRQIRECYERELSQTPKLSGEVEVKFVISPSGSVSKAWVARTTVGSTALEACVAGRVSTWLFPAPKGGGVVTVTYPFIFAQPEDSSD